MPSAKQTDQKRKIIWSIDKSNKNREKLPQTEKEHLPKNLQLYGEGLNAFPLTSKRRHWCLLLPLLFNIVLKVLAIVIRQEKKIKDIPIGKGNIKLFLFADKMFVYSENSKESSNNKMLELMSSVRSQKTNQHTKVNYVSLYWQWTSRTEIKN